MIKYICPNCHKKIRLTATINHVLIHDYPMFAMLFGEKYKKIKCTACGKEAFICAFTRVEH